MIRGRVVLAALAALVLFAWQDVMLWDRALGGDLRFAGVYHDGWRVMRDGLIIAGAVLLWRRWWEMVFWVSTLYAGSVTGFTDALFFWLQGQSVPDWIAWECGAWWAWCSIPGPVRGTSAFLTNVAVWAALWAALWMALAWLAGQAPTLSSKTRRTQRLAGPGSRRDASEPRICPLVSGAVGTLPRLGLTSPPEEG